MTVVSCKKEKTDDLFGEPSSSQNHANPSPETEEGSETLMEFDSATPNPYTVENMTSALDNLINKGELSCNSEMFNIRVTHKYIKFKPVDSAQYFQISSDTTLHIYDYPMDRKLIKAGTYYRDPSLKDDQQNFLWASVPVNQEISNEVPYDILAELYIPEEDPNLVQYYDTGDDICITQLIEEALILTGNLDTTDNFEVMTSGGELGSMRRGSAWLPVGMITMTDDNLGVVPIKGCKVRATHWFTTGEGLTFANGYFVVDRSFRTNVTYSIKWDRHDFEIRHKRIGQAYFNGPNMRGNWVLNITLGYSRMYAIIHRAAHRYYYEGTTARADLRTPPLKRNMLGKITIGAFEWDEAGANGDIMPLKRWIGMPEIRIFRPNRPDRWIFATTIHELAHASHWELGTNNDFTFCDEIVAETWARGVQWAITRLEYPIYDDEISGFYGRMNYTGAVQDMIDGFSIKSSTRFWSFPLKGWHPLNVTRTYSDEVEGYTIRQIEDALVGQRTWNGWRNNIKNLYNNATENNLDATFLYWNTAL